MADISENAELFQRIRESDVFANYRAAFEAATGLPLEIHPFGEDFKQQDSANMNAFCKILNENNRCPDCVAAAHCISSELSSTPSALRCFAGMSESAVPVLAGRTPIAVLTTGQVFTGQRTDAAWPGVASRLQELGFESDRIAELEDAWKRTREIAPDQYDGMVSLLAVFAGQLSELAEKLVLEARDSEPETVLKARQYVSAHLSEPIELADVARHVGMSQFHFCRVFKQATGLTFKQYLTRRRVEWAKCRLRKPDARVTEVAYDVGFGSLSQFNRSFLRLVGLSPSDWRNNEFSRFAKTA